MIHIYSAFFILYHQLTLNVIINNGKHIFALGQNSSRNNQRHGFSHDHYLGPGNGLKERSGLFGG